MKIIPYGTSGWHSVSECLPTQAPNITEGQTQFMILQTENGEVIPAYWSQAIHNALQNHIQKYNSKDRICHGFVGYNNYGRGQIIAWQYPPAVMVNSLQ